MENACELLKELGKISDYKINREGKLEQSSIAFYFFENKSILDKANAMIGVEATGQETIEIERIEEKILEVVQAENQSECHNDEALKLFDLLPEMEKIEIRKDQLEELLGQHSYEYLKEDMEYCNRKKTDNYWAYFMGSFKSSGGHYSAAEIEKQKVKEAFQKKKSEIKEKRRLEEENYKKVIRDESENIYEKLTEVELEDYEKIYKEQEIIYI